MAMIVGYLAQRTIDLTVTDLRRMIWAGGFDSSRECI